jgi:dienelactone hydrolase
MDTLRERIQAFLRVSLTHPPPEIQYLGRAAGDGFTRSLVQFPAPDGEQIEAYLFQPTDPKPHGAILALHQHNSQWELGKSEIAGLTGDPFQAFGPALASRGVTVLAPDCIGFESRLGGVGWGTSLVPPLRKTDSTPEGWLHYYNQMAHRLVSGDLLMRKLLEDSATALSVLQILAKVDHSGVIGHSFGGSLALFLAALETRISFCCANGSVCSYRHKMANQTAIEMSLIIPGFSAQFDFEDLLRCIAPRRIFVVSSEDDPFSADAEDLVRCARPAFEELGRTDHLEHLHTSSGHALDQLRFEAIVGWAAKQANCSSLI